MKVLMTGASGALGGEMLMQCLQHPDITKVVAFARKELPAEISSNPKVQTVIIKDFSQWSKDILRAHTDAAAMIWAMGTYSGSITVDLEYPVAFIDAFGSVLKEGSSRRVPFRWIQLSGTFVTQQQDKSLWFLDSARKMKGRLETKGLTFANENPTIWQSFIVRPAVVITKSVFGGGLIKVVTGDNMSVRNEELGAYMAYLAASGTAEESGMIENRAIVVKGKKLLAEQKAVKKAAK